MSMTSKQTEFIAAAKTIQTTVTNGRQTWFVRITKQDARRVVREDPDGWTVEYDPYTRLVFLMPREDGSDSDANLIGID